MNRLIDDIGLEPWDIGPGKNAAILVKIPQEKRIEWERPVSLPRPVRKPKNIVKVSKQFSVIAFNDIVLQPTRLVKNNGRKFKGARSPMRMLNKTILRTSSCAESNTSIFDIEKIERIQKLLPFTPMVSYKARSLSNGRSLCMHEELGRLKTSGLTQKNYRKYIKRSN